MTERPLWAPREVNLDVPSSARIYDYLLGGGHNFEKDRAAADNLLQVVPAKDMAARNRAFLCRAVHFLVESGIRQFLDLGSGVPTAGNVHEVAQDHDPLCRVVYVDIESVAVAHSELLLENNENATVIQADLRDPEAVFDSAETRRLIDPDQPLGLLMVGVMQFLPDAADPWNIVAGYRERLAPGSYLAMSHFTPDGNPEAMAKAVEVFKNTQEPAHPRTRDQVMRMFEGFDLVDPGLVYTVQWRPEPGAETDDHPEKSNLYAAVGRKR